MSVICRTRGKGHYIFIYLYLHLCICKQKYCCCCNVFTFHSIVSAGFLIMLTLSARYNPTYQVGTSFYHYYGMHLKAFLGSLWYHFFQPIYYHWTVRLKRRARVFAICHPTQKKDMWDMFLMKRIMSIRSRGQWNIKEAYNVWLENIT